MATRASKTSTVKAKAEKSTKTSAPKVARVRQTRADATSATDELIAPSYDAIAARAYVRFCARGGEHGSDVEDWLAAEAELRQQ
ncbi:MAG TPA: DUF2934 domain-containing protein [Polyangia bacterium]|jgi:hypothetical protein|nr:DUF2934 domain-containing protein [Polyangia bacterium]